MTISSILQTIFSFRTGSTTVLASLFYLAIFVSLYRTQSGPQVPSIDRQHALGISVDQAYRDLHLVTERPHPYNSRQNDVVRHFLLQRLQDIAEGHDFVHVDDDIRTNVAFLDSSRAVYFQGNNVLVKIDGTDNVTEGDGVLFSAHFDSVSTAPGATDDGMSVVALLQLVDFLCENRPRRTAVFNINNGEEDGLHGAHTFLRHPWSDLTSTFLNIEGAGSGGRPFLFRTTSYEILKAFRSAPHIHADAISQDAWDQRIIRSDTDYSVYSAPRTRGVSSLTETNATARGYVGPGGGMQGADIAFYTGRSRYHTMDDTIRGMGDGGAQKSLWSLLELLHSASDSILNRSDPISSGENERAVYFELFGVYLVAFPFHILLVSEIILLIVGPILLAGLGYVLVQQSILSPPLPARMQWGSNFRGYGRFWLALILSAGAQVGLVVGFLKLNPNTAHSHPVATSLSALSLAYLSLAIPLQLAQRLRPIPPSRQRSIVLVQLYGLTWVFLAITTFLTQRVIIAGLYWIALWNASLLMATVLGAFEGLWGTGKAGRIVLSREESEGEGEEDPRPRGRHQQQDESDTSETTPLLRRRTSPTHSLVLDETAQDKAYFWWIFQFMISTTAPVVNLATIYTIWIGAMPQTISDGDWVGIVYAPISLLCFLILLPLAPFVHKVHRVLTIFILLIFIFSTAYAWIATPFTSNSRLKVFFAHQVELTNVSATTPSPQLTRAVTQIDVIEGYGPRLAATLPSSQHYSDDSSKKCGTSKLGSTRCEWAVPPVLYPSIPGAKEDSWFVANVTRRGPASLRVEIEGVETRACRIYVDSHSIKRYRARSIGSPQVEWSTFNVPASKKRDIRLLALWSRSWDTKKFQADLELDATDEEGAEEPIAGRVSCLWNDGPGGALIPALEEARGFLPEWVAISKAASGLVEASSGFVL
ncbi:hypothetical protein BJY52DRAFT_1315924 [Lactarius psammicola]|nr:hypothetical protein BJY52DRAFT_1315924 [Lactarius psammicola]